MSNRSSRKLTFAKLDRDKGFPDLPPATGEEYPLPAWYRAVSNTPIEELGLEDICRACRQEIHIEHVVPIALRILQSTPLAGEMYDGELLASLRSIPSNYWTTHLDEATALKRICEVISGDANLPGDVRQDIAELLLRVAP